MSPTATTTAFTIRPAAASDLAAVERLLTTSKLPIEGVREAFANFVVAESKGRLVGVAGLEPCGHDSLLRSVAVESDWRSQGVGRALVTRAIADAESRGCRALYLLTTTAERYFPSFGFQAIKREDAPADVQKTEEFAKCCPGTAVAMARRLREPSTR